jgi:hypothetical protein
MKSKLKVPGTKRLKLRYDHLLSAFAFNSNLRRYKTVSGVLVSEDAVRRCTFTLSNPR